MANKDAGRNDPCPCGSGKKYKKCCLAEGASGASFSGLENVFGGERQFNALEEAPGFVRRFAQRCNQTELDDFQGLSPDQMHCFLYFPFESPQLAEFAEELGQNPDVPVLTLFRLLAAEIPEKGLKPTAKGNLPRKVCRETALEYLGEDCYRDLTLFRGINSEADFIDLNVVRIVSEQAGLIRKYKGKFILGRKCRGYLTESRFDLIYIRLFRTYAETFYWEYRDPHLSCDLIQNAFLFSLYLLARYGNKPRPQFFYEDCFLQAFPGVLERVEPGAYFTPEQRVRTSYSERTLTNFLKFFGLAKVQPLLTERTHGRDYEVAKLPLLDQVVHFYLV